MRKVNGRTTTIKVAYVRRGLLTVIKDKCWVKDRMKPSYRSCVLVWVCVWHWYLIISSWYRELTAAPPKPVLLSDPRLSCQRTTCVSSTVQNQTFVPQMLVSAHRPAPSLTESTRTSSSRSVFYGLCCSPMTSLLSVLNTIQRCWVSIYSPCVWTSIFSSIAWRVTQMRLEVCHSETSLWGLQAMTS